MQGVEVILLRRSFRRFHGGPATPHSLNRPFKNIHHFLGINLLSIYEFVK